GAERRGQPHSRDRAARHPIGPPVPPARQGHDRAALESARRHVHPRDRRDAGQSDQAPAGIAPRIRKRRREPQDQPGKRGLLRPRQGIFRGFAGVVVGHYSAATTRSRREGAGKGGAARLPLASTAPSAARISSSFASLSGRANGPPSWSCTQSVSSAMPFDIVTILASTMLAPDTASAPAMRENRPGWSAV